MVNVSTLNTKTPSENGAFMQLRHPVTNELITTKDGEKAGLMVRGNEAPTVQKVLKKMNNRMGKGGAQSAREREAQGLLYARALVMSFENLEHENGHPLAADDESDVEWFFNQSNNFVTQVVEFAEDTSNFFKTPDQD